MINANQIYAEIYSSGTTRNDGASIILDDIQDIQFATGYPGGQMLDAKFYIPRDIREYWPLQGGQRVVLRNGIKLVYEGYITSFEMITNDQDSGIMVTMIGAWGWIAMRRRWGKIWADTRTDAGTWKWVAGLDFNETANWEIERTNRLAMGCKTSCSYYAVYNPNMALEYTAQDGETIKRITYDYEILDSGATPDFTFSVYRTDPSPAEVASSVVTSGSDKFDYDFVTPCNKLQLRIKPNGDFTTSSNDYWWVILTKLCVYTETTDYIYIYDLAQDVVSKFSAELSASTSYISNDSTYINTAVKLIGQPSASFADANYPNSFGAFNFETMADILAMGAGYGRGSVYNYGRIGYGLYPSDLSDSANGKPVLFVEDYPDPTSTYDYLIGIDDINLLAPLQITQDIASVRNYVIVHYNDDEGYSRYLTPTDNALLNDTASIVTYGQHDYMVDVGYAQVATAVEAGIRLVKYYKDPKYQLLTPIRVFDYLEDDDGQRVPVSHVRAGSIVKLRNWFSNTADANSRIAFLITHTQYDDVSNSVTLTAGPPPDLIIPATFRAPSYSPLINPQRQGLDTGGDGYDDPRGGFNDERLRLFREGGGHGQFRPGGKPIVRPPRPSGGLGEEHKP